MKKLLIGTMIAFMAFVSLPALGGDKIGIQIVFDDSGSMRDSAPNGKVSKYDAGKEALRNIGRQIEDFVAKNPTSEVQVGLITFDPAKEYTAKIIKPISVYNKNGFNLAVNAIPRPSCNTPLGEAIFTAYKSFPNDPDMKKHVFVITDGEQNGHLSMEEVISKYKAKAGVYFVAFDVNASVFSASKAQGALVTQADDATQLFAKVAEIFEKQILLEQPD